MQAEKTDKIKNICVFASSSSDIDDVYFEDAKNLGVLLAKNSYDIVYGGSELGLMGAVTNSAKKNGSNIIGVMPEKLYNIGISEGNCDKFILTKDMRERKAKMDEISDAVIAIAGGFGTLDELFEMIVLKQLNYNNKPIIILNTNGYYNLLVEFLNDVINKKFASKSTNSIFYVADNPAVAINYLMEYKALEINYIKDKIKKLSL